MLEWMKENGSISLLVGEQIGVVITEIGMEFTHKPRNRSTAWSSCSTLKRVPKGFCILL